MSFSENATVVVVHGAWADGSSWQAIVGPLEDRGLNVIAAPIPLTSLSDDAAALKRTIARTQGPVLVAGHAYAGAVIATANDERVKALVYVAVLRRTRERRLLRCFTETNLIQRRHNSVRMQMDLSGCLTKGLPTPLPRMPRRNRLRCPRRCSGQCPSGAY